MSLRPLVKTAFVFTETITVTAIVVLAITALNTSPFSRVNWLAIPSILVAAAIVPTAIKKRKFNQIGFNVRQVKDSFVVLGWTCALVFPVCFSVLWLLNYFGFGLPLQPMLPQNQNWIYWLFYQFIYVAVAEEIFFRGYVLTNILSSTAVIFGGRDKLQLWISIAISSALFAAAHIAVQGHIVSALTFLPGLITGWLFVRTRSLLAPVLFHGLANIFYWMTIEVFI